VRRANRAAQLRKAAASVAVLAFEFIGCSVSVMLANRYI
jgi:hypothetical protein